MKIQYSKILPFVSGLIFIGCLCVAFTADMSTIVDTTIYATAITISGGIFGSAIVWYAKKAQSENLYKIKIQMYKDATSERLRFNEGMMILKQKYGMSDSDVEEIEMNGDIDEMTESALSDAVNAIDEAEADANSAIEIQNY